MDEPTIAELLDKIDVRVAGDYADPDVLIQFLRGEDSLLIRHPDWEAAFRVTVARVPRE